MSNIKVLDCTLRDGGYINDWDFGKEKIKTIIALLNKSKVDYIETGFMINVCSMDSKTLFEKFSDIEKLVDANVDIDKLLVMIPFGKFPIERVPDSNETLIKGIRLIFKKHQKNEALEYCKALKNKGYKLFINPTFVDQYTDSELTELINEINEIKPYSMAIVDSMGILKESELLRLYNIINSRLNEEISLCFHSHNNLQLSFSNAQCLMKICKNRELIIDSTVFGMGRGAGNLCTELLTQYLNDNYEGYYDIVPILKIIDEHINPIFAKTPWGYSVPYYLAATAHCHPNYAKYLDEKQTVTVEVINKILKLIPDDKKAVYDEDLIRQIYLDTVTKSVEDSTVLNEISDILKDKNILVIGPGKTLKTEENKVDEFIKKENPYIISLNFESKLYKSDMTFVTNPKRFSALPKKMSSKLVVTSNIDNVSAESLKLNYSSYLNKSKMFDNTALMLLKLLIKLGIKKVSIAGLDGFNQSAGENYVLDKLINNSKTNEFKQRNKVMSEELRRLSNDIKIDFVTNTKYEIG